MMVIEIDRKDRNKIRVAHVKDEMQVGDKRIANLVFEKMGLGDQAMVVPFADDHDPMQTSGTTAARVAFAGRGRGGMVGGARVWGGARPGIGYGRPGIGRPGLGYGARYPYARGLARGAYWGARYGYGAAYGTGYYNPYGYYNEPQYGGYTDPNAHYNDSYYGGGYYDESYGGEDVYAAGYAPIYQDYAYSGCGSYCGGAWARPFYNYYGYYYPYRPYYSWASATSYYVYCRPWSWWG